MAEPAARAPRTNGARPRVVKPRDPIGRLPPHDLGAESAVLAAAMRDDDEVCDRALEILRPEHFYSEAHQLVWAVIAELRAEGIEVELQSVESRLRAASRTQQVGGLRYLTDLVTKVPAVANVATHANVVLDRALLRMSADAHRRAAAEVYDATDYQTWRAATDEAFAAIAAPELATTGWERIDAAGIFEDLGPIPWLVEALDIAPGPPAMIAGYGYSMKTLACQQLAVAVASGTELWGRWPIRQGRVVHVDFEQGKRLTRDRYQRLGRAAGLGPAELLGMLNLVSYPPGYLDSPGALKLWTRELDGHALCIVDSFRAAAPLTDENSSEARVPLDMLSRVSEATGCVVVVVHHCRKPQRDAPGGAKMAIRGSGALFDASASVLVFEGEKGQPVNVSHEKARITGRMADPFVLVAEDVQIGQHPHAGLRVLAADAEEHADARAEADNEARCDAVLAFVRANPRCSTTELRAGVRGKNATIDVARDTLIRAGAIKDLGRKRSEWVATGPGGTTP